MALAEFQARRAAVPSRLAPVEARLLRALALVVFTGVLGAGGALFVILLYGRLIPSGSHALLVLAGGAALALVGLQALIRSHAGNMADEASQDLMARLETLAEPARTTGLPLVRALRTRSFLLAADLVWVPVFLLTVLVLHPLFALATGLALAGLLCFGAGIEPPSPRPDATFRRQERTRRLTTGSLRDAMQIMLLTLGGALAISGRVQMGEIVAATLLSLKAIGAVSAALDDAPALRSAFRSWRAIRNPNGIG
jgi:ABC-type protease/lipase transport system fused ATPase/permease subunit